MEYDLNNRRTRIRIGRDSVFDCHLSHQMAIENYVSNDFFIYVRGYSIKVFDCRLSGVKKVSDSQCELVLALAQKASQRELATHYY